VLGIVGLPFFALSKTGIDVVLGATGGYLVGFVIAAAIVGRLAELGWDRNLLGAIGAMVIANAAIYVIAVPWLAYVTHHDLAWGVQFGLWPFLGGDALEGPRHIWWNFVSSSKERIEQAKADWKSGRFAPVPNEHEFIPLPE